MRYNDVYRSVYNGVWKDGIRDGRGTLRDATGNFFDGEWSQGE